MSDVMTNWILEAALDYAAAGFAVIPVKRSDKAPYTPNGVKDASTEPRTIRAWWAQWPDANVAIACGRPSGNVFVIDIDIKPEEGKHGDVSIHEWQAVHGDFPNTVVQITGSGGLHRFFHFDRISDYLNKVETIPGVDIRGDGAYVVVAPSIYEDGRTYKWQNEVSILDTVEISEANQSVIDLLERYKRGAKNTSAPVEKSLMHVPKGQRNDRVFKYACAQRGYDFPFDVTLSGALQMVSGWDNPLSSYEVEKAVRSAYEHYKPNDPEKRAEDPEEEPDEDDLVLSTLEEFEEKEVEWLIPGYIPKEQITILCGTGGTGKTSFWVSLVASLSSGSRTLFDGLTEDAFLKKRDPMTVMFFSGEDTVEHVIKKKMRIQKATMKNIIAMSVTDKRFKKVKLNSKYLEKLIDKYRPGLCVLDPLQSFTPTGKFSMKERNDIRQIMQSLIEWGERYGTTFLVVMHSNKQQNAWGRTRMADSADLWDIARSVLMVGDTEDAGTKYLSQEKSNYGRCRDTMLFTNENGNPVFKAWSRLKDKDFVVAETKRRNSSKGPSDVEEAAEFIMSAVTDSQDGINSKELDDLMEEAGFKQWAVRKAKSELRSSKKITYERKGMGGSVCVKKK